MEDRGIDQWRGGIHVEDRRVDQWRGGIHVEDRRIDQWRGGIHVEDRGIDQWRGGIHVEDRRVDQWRGGIHVEDRRIDQWRGGIHVEDRGIDQWRGGTHVEDGVWARADGQHVVCSCFVWRSTRKEPRAMRWKLRAHLYRRNIEELCRISKSCRGGQYLYILHLQFNSFYGETEQRQTR